MHQGISNDVSASLAHPIAMTSADAAKAIGVGAKTLANWRHQGKGPAYYHLSDSPRSQVLYSYEDLMAWMRSLRRCDGS